MFNPVAQLIALVLAAVGMALSYLEADQRKDWWVKGLVFYVLPCSLWAIIGVAQFGWVPYPDGCTSSKCRMAAGPGLLVQAYIRQGGVLAVGVVYLAITAFLRHYWNRIVAWDLDRLRNRVDLNKWYHDPATGEFYEITEQYDGAFSHLTKPWAHRKMREYETVQTRMVARILAALCWFLLVIVAANSHDTYGWNVILWCLFGLACVATAGALFMGLMVRQAIKRTGPRRLMPQEDTTVEDQRVHDTGGLMNKEQLEAALRGEVGSKPIRSRPQSA